MQHRIAIIAIAAGALIIAACADQDGRARLSTEPGDATPALQYVTTRSAAVVDPRTHRLVQVRGDSGSSSRIRASIVAVNGGDADALQLPSVAPGIAHVGGSATQVFIDAAKNRHTIVFLYRSTGGPPAAVQHYINGSLVSTNAYTWMRTSTGWVRTSSPFQAVRNGVLYGTYATATVPRTPVSGGQPQTVRLDRQPSQGPVQKMFASAAYGLAFALAPQDAGAQVNMYFDECRIEWLKYGAAASALIAVYAGFLDAPYLTPILVMQLSGALALAGVAEDMLISCMLAHDTFAVRGFGGGAGSGAGNPKWDCFIGSYAAHCTTPFTL
jgi:hypothetical protein